MAAKLIVLAACVSAALAQYAVPAAYYKPAAVYAAPSAYYKPAPVYAAAPAAYFKPAPVYAAAPAAYFKPAPVYAAAPAAYYKPAPVYAAAPAVYYKPAPVYAAYKPAYAVPEPSYPPTPYNFEYAVNDYSTGDIKSQAEYSDGKNVKGYYSLVEADGTKRIVEYTADGYGFNAVVKKEGTPSYAPVAPYKPY